MRTLLQLLAITPITTAVLFAMVYFPPVLVAAAQRFARLLEFFASLHLCLFAVSFAAVVGLSMSSPLRRIKRLRRSRR